MSYGPHSGDYREHAHGNDGPPRHELFHARFASKPVEPHQIEGQNHDIEDGRNDDGAAIAVRSENREIEEGCRGGRRWFPGATP